MTRGEDLRAADRVPYRLLDEVPDLSRGGDDSHGKTMGEQLRAAIGRE
ncbi:hypothetical protein [uncultured Sulfitobacter sp.]